MNPPPHSLDSAPGPALGPPALAELANAGLQKLWLLSAAHLVLQLRLPGRNLHAVVDARGAGGALLELVELRPAPPEPALPSQANLRRLLEGARVLAVRAERFAEGEGARKTSLRLTLESPQGPRALVAEARTQLLFVLGADAKGEGERILWAAPGAPEERRSGARWPAVVEAALETAAVRESGAGVHAEREAIDAKVAAQRQAALAREVKARLKKLLRTQAAVEGDRERARSGEGERRNAELLLPHQSKIARGASTATVPDWSQLDDEGKPLLVTLRLDPAFPAAENAARWLRHAQRVRAALPRIEERHAELGRSIERLRALGERLAAASGPSVLAALEAELGQASRAGAARASGGARAPAQARRQPFRTFVAASGARILVGRSAKDNDALTRLAKGNDLWLHARGVQGSHVILPDPGEAPDATTLGEAALLAAHFSSGRGEDEVLVSWTRRKFVRKGKGAAPGAVTFTQEKTLRVRSDEGALSRLLAGERSQ